MLGFAPLGSLPLGAVSANAGPVAYALAAASGSFALTGSAAATLASRKLSAATGSFALSGSAATLALVHAPKIICLVSGASWTVPDDVDGGVLTSVECIGAGANGYNTNSNQYSHGGNGGCYAITTGLAVTAGAILAYQIGAANGSTGAGTASANTWFDSITTVLAAGASTSTSNCVGSLTYAGGAGANSVQYGFGGGAGGAAGPHGAGGAGGTGGSTNPGNGGAGDAGSGGAGGTGFVQGTTPPGNGGAGAEWTATGGGTYGTGGGGQGGSDTVAGNGGNYGAGGGGYSGGTGGTASGGLIVVTYTPISSTAYALAAATGSFTLTGSAANLAAETQHIAGATGSFALTGSSANLDAASRHLGGATGSFALTGHAASFVSRHALSGASGSFTLTGSAANLDAASRHLDGATGSFGVTGSPASFAGLARPTTPFALLLAAGMAGNLPVLGCYTVPESDIYDNGFAGTLTLSADWQVSGSPAGSNILDLTDFLGQTDMLSAALSAGMVSWLEINVGIDAPDGGIAWAGWQKYAAGDYQARYLARRWFVQAPNAQTVGAMTVAKDQCSVPNRVDKYLNQSVPSQGLTIAFTPTGSTVPVPFNKGPSTAQYPQGEPLPNIIVGFNNQAGDVLLVSGLGLAGVTLQILNGGSGVARTVQSITVEGF